MPGGIGPGIRVGVSGFTVLCEGAVAFLGA
jgi:hypothetical protein